MTYHRNLNLLFILLVILSLGENARAEEGSDNQRTPASIPKFPSADAEKKTPSPGEPVDKDQYSLFNPTPLSQMRELETDRPGVTNGPRTVDAGHLKIESGLFTYSEAKEEKTYTYNNLSIAVGLTNKIEFEAEIDGYVHGTDASGFGDTNLGLKLNLLGNDGGLAALGLIVTVKFPTNSGGVGNSSFEGAVSLPFAFSLPSEWTVSIMPELDRVKNQDEGYHRELYTAFVLGYAIVGDLGGFGQFSSRVSNEPGTEGSADAGFGFTYLFSPNFQIDTDLRFGLTNTADSFVFSTGIAFRY